MDTIFQPITAPAGNFIVHAHAHPGAVPHYHCIGRNGNSATYRLDGTAAEDHSDADSHRHFWPHVHGHGSGE